MKALVINHFNGVCADCGGIIMDNPGGDFIQGCYIGTDAAGIAPTPTRPKAFVVIMIRSIDFTSFKISRMWAP